MIAQASVVDFQVNILDNTACSAAQLPAQTHPTKPSTPKTVTTTVLRPSAPRMPNPIAKAKGIVSTMVNRPQGLSAKAFTTTKASTAISMVMIPSSPITASVPATGPTSSRSICPTDFPFRRRLSQRMMLSWTAPPSTAPIRIQRRPGRYPNWAAKTGPTRGPGPAMAAK